MTTPDNSKDPVCGGCGSTYANHDAQECGDMFRPAPASPSKAPERGGEDFRDKAAAQVVIDGALVSALDQQPRGNPIRVYFEVLQDAIETALREARESERKNAEALVVALEYYCPHVDNDGYCPPGHDKALCEANVRDAALTAYQSSPSGERG